MSNGRQVSNNEESIRDRAHAIWESEGRPEGKHFEHWQRAEQEAGRAAQGSPSSRTEAHQTRRVTSKGKKPK